MDEILGLAKTTYHRLEAGSKSFRLQELIDFCEKEKKLKQLERCFLKSIGVSVAHKNAFKSFQDFLELWGEPSVSFIEEKLQYSSSTWWRLKNNKSELSFDDFMEMVSYRTGKSQLLIGLLEKEFSGEGFREKEENYFNVRNFLKYNPDFPLLTAAVDLLPYKSSHLSLDEFLIKKSGLNISRYHSLKRQLLNLGILVPDTKFGLRSDERFEFRFNEQETGNVICASILSRSFDLEEQSFLRKTYFVQAVSKDTKNKIRNILVKNYQEIIQVLEQDSGPKQEILEFGQVAFSPKSGLDTAD